MQGGTGKAEAELAAVGRVGRGELVFFWQLVIVGGGRVLEALGWCSRWCGGGGWEGSHKIRVPPPSALHYIPTNMSQLH